MFGFYYDLVIGEVIFNFLVFILNFEVFGLVVKVGILIVGYEIGVIKGNDVLIDEVILLVGSNLKVFWWNVFGGIIM